MKIDINGITPTEKNKPLFDETTDMIKELLYPIKTFDELSKSSLEIIRIILDDNYVSDKFPKLPDQLEKLEAVVNDKEHARMYLITNVCSISNPNRSYF